MTHLVCDGVGATDMTASQLGEHDLKYLSVIKLYLWALGIGISNVPMRQYPLIFINIQNILFIM